MVVLEPPIDWRDVYPGRPSQFFKKYDRRCSSRQDVERDETVGHNAVAVYFHNETHPSRGSSLF